ncbi:MAG TPA: PAN domain-containing protein [Oligoflexus sp.]|uniref:PAN domain-containing protein n=1 Tax=Oligoflexus sp. TaxID=1971216 RepID=UPI002D48F4C2|nr:PAN domain-containing protein [Oligoflexus sp.]HYX33459.1 PAN domain-containing protein [Oligoflexus sp.]
MKLCSLLYVTMVASAISSSSFATITYFEYPGWDCPNHGDYKSFPTTSKEDCFQECLNDQGCSAATLNYDQSRCWMKNSTTTFEPNNSVIALKAIAIEDGVDYTGGDYGSLPTANAQDCSRICFLDEECRAFTYRTSTQTCWLKNTIISRNTYPDAQGGIR